MTTYSRKTLSTLAAIITMALLTACNHKPHDEKQVNELPSIFPDYVGVTIPSDIAPLNFSVNDAGRVDVTVTGSNGETLHANGPYARFDIDEWHRLLRDNQGSNINVRVCARQDDGTWVSYRTFSIAVSSYPLGEWGLTYRRVAPGYVNYSSMGLYQRSLADYEEKAIFENTAIEGGCINCHSSNRTDPRQFTFHVRGSHGATLLQTDGQRLWLDTKTDKTLGTCVYPYWHPTGRYVAFSTNRTNQAFHGINDRRVEVFDHASDLQVYDVENHRLLLSPLIKTPDWMETYPSFSPDGRTLYFCTSRQYDDIGNHFRDIRYNICAISFNPDNGTFGQQVDTLFNAEAIGKSAVHPRPSYDGRHLLFTLCDYGCFSIWHKESDQWMMDLQNRQTWPLTATNSPRAESYHNWSINSRWIVFTSRRENGLNSLLYIAAIDSTGHAAKPFLLPQRNPREYYDRATWSFNTPDFTLSPVNFNWQKGRRETLSDKRTKITAEIME